MTINNNYYKTKHNPSKILQDFNWGACLLTFIWGIKHKAWHTFLIIPIIYMYIPIYIKLVILFCFHLYCGVNGNKWAYYNKEWKSIKSFNKEQLKWAILGGIIFIFIPLAWFSIYSEFLIKNSQNPRSFIENSQCAIAYDKLEKGLPKVVITEETTDENIARQFANMYSNTKPAGNTVFFNLNSQLRHKESLSITFNKNSGEICNLHQYNCSIEASYVIAAEHPNMKTCHYNFDKNKQILPDTETQNAINKGTNIFNYL